MTEMVPLDKLRRRCLPVDEWPEADRLAWEEATLPGDLLDGTVGLAFHWSPQTRRKRRKGYGRWLNFLSTAGLLDPADHLADRITPKRIEAYVEELRSLVQSWTVYGRLEDLRAMATTMAPDRDWDWDWLRQIVRRLEALGRDSRNKFMRMQTAGDIAGWATTEMDCIVAEDRWDKRTLTEYRNALMVGLLIACPTMRLGNLRMIETGQHLVLLTEGYRLDFAASETKTRRPWSIPVPAFLTPYLDLYLSSVRPMLLKENETSRLWLNYKGDPLSKIYDLICKTTERAFGKPINPHLFRDCAATTVALEDPEHIGIAAPILGHTDPRTTEEHYIRANSIAAGRRLRKSIDKLKDEHRRHKRRKQNQGNTE